MFIPQIIHKWMKHNTKKLGCCGGAGTLVLPGGGGGLEWTEKCSCARWGCEQFGGAGLYGDQMSMGHCSSPRCLRRTPRWGPAVDRALLVALLPALDTWTGTSCWWGAAHCPAACVGRLDGDQLSMGRCSSPRCLHRTPGRGPAVDGALLVAPLPLSDAWTGTSCRWGAARHPAVCFGRLNEVGTSWRWVAACHPAACVGCLDGEDRLSMGRCSSPRCLCRTPGWAT